MKQGINFISIPIPLVRYDIGTKGISSNKLEMIKANYKAYKYITNSKILSFNFVVLTILKRIGVEIIRKIKLGFYF